jgi:cysteine desulfurase
MYLDANATHPLLPSVRAGLAQAILNEDPVISNPSSIHQRGQVARSRIAALKNTLCEILGRPDRDEFVMVSGATEAINLSLRGFVADRQFNRRPVTVIGTDVDHSAVVDTMKDLASQDLEVQWVGVDASGQPDSEQLKSRIRESVAAHRDVLLCLQVANNEVGSVPNLLPLLQDLYQEHGPKALNTKTRLKGGRVPQTPQVLWVMLDLAQAVGKLDESWLRPLMHFADYAVISAHKLGGPTGVGALWQRPSAPLKAQITGGPQERRRRAGTMPQVAAYGFHLALLDWQKNGTAYRAQWAELQSRLAAELAQIPGLHLHACGPGHSLPGLRNTLNFHVDGCVEESLLLALDLEGVCVSSGSACNSGSLKPSPVIMALGYPESVALSSIRVSWGVETQWNDLQTFCRILTAKVDQIRRARIESAALFQSSTESSGDSNVTEARLS